jgi:ubiquinol-cytochrome c reductase cytochrome b subunit
LDGIPFHPYYTVKDIVGVIAFAAVFAGIIFFAPGMHGLFLEPDNFVPANPYGASPADIHPLWYFAPYYAILRSIPNKLTGVITMGAAILMLFVLPWLDTNPIKSLRYRGLLYRRIVLVFGITFVLLAYIGMQALSPFWAQIGQRCTELYFLFFVVSWVYSKPRSRKFLIRAFVIVMALVTLADILDIVGWPPSFHELVDWKTGENTLQLYSWLLPGIYSAVFLLLPAFAPKLNEQESVPERVTH